MGQWLISLVGIIVVAASLHRFSGTLKPIQGWGVTLGLILAVLPWLPAGTYGAFGASYEKKEEDKKSAAVVASTNDQFNKLVQRIAALEARIKLLELPKATPAQRQAVATATVRAKRSYNSAAQAAAAARRDYIKQLDRFDDLPGCCESSTIQTDYSPSDTGLLSDLPPVPENPNTVPCCNVVTEAERVESNGQ